MSDGYEIVKTSNEKYVCYKVHVKSDDESWFILKRYTEFRNLYKELNSKFPDAKFKIPPKKYIQKFSKKVIDERVKGLNLFVGQVFMTPGALELDSVVDFFDLKKAFNNSDQIDSEKPLSETGPEHGEETTLYGNKMDPTDFELKKVIGKGAFGNVFLAQHKESGKHYALKVLQKSRVKSQIEKQHLMSERFVLLSNLNHPFLVALHYAFQTPVKLYFVLDFVNGGELFYHLQKERSFGEERTKFYGAEIACALGFLHSRHILYRDLKPENLILDKMGHVIITDFGLSKERMNELPNSLTSTFCGTPEYLAPEVLRGESYSYPIDWWCLGCVMYELMFGAPPFYHKDHIVLYEAIKRHPLKLNRRNIHLSQAATDVLSSLMDKNHSFRLGTNGGVKEIEQHPFFRNLDFAKLEAKQIEAPFVPGGDDDYAGHIDPEWTEMSIPESVTGKFNNRLSVAVSPCTGRGFEGFTYKRVVHDFD